MKLEKDFGLAPAPADVAIRIYNLDVRADNQSINQSVVRLTNSTPDCVEVENSPSVWRASVNQQYIEEVQQDQHAEVVKQETDVIFYINSYSPPSFAKR